MVGRFCTVGARGISGREKRLRGFLLRSSPRRGERRLRLWGGRCRCFAEALRFAAALVLCRCRVAIPWLVARACAGAFPHSGLVRGHWHTRGLAARGG